MNTTISDIAKNSLRTPLSIQNLSSGSNETSRSNESVDSSNAATNGGITIPADQLGTENQFHLSFNQQ